jgi:hypothetical protein
MNAHEVWTAFSRLTLVGFLLTTAASAATYRITVDSPRVVSEPWMAHPLDIGTRISTLDRVEMRVSGIHSNGWWVGDGLIDDYVGPRGAELTVYLFPGAEIEIPGMATAGWYQGRISCTNDGVFAIDLALMPSPRYLVRLPFVADGGMALSCFKEQQYSIGFGGMTRQPHLELSSVEVQIHVTPVLEITSIHTDGILSWSALPAGGTVDVLTKEDLDGPWVVAMSVSGEMGSADIQPPEGEVVKFIRLQWREGESP